MAARADRPDLGLQLLEWAISRRFYPVGPMELDPWLENIRGTAKFDELQARAVAGHKEGLAAFRAAKGERLVGVATG